MTGLLAGAGSALFNLLVVLYAKRVLRLHRERIERALTGVESVIYPPKGIRMTVRTKARAHRTGIAAVVGVLLIGLLTWATSEHEVQLLLAPLLPPTVRPLAGVLAGGIATVAAVVLANRKRDEQQAPSEDASTLEQPAPPSASTPVVDEPDPAGTAPTVAADATPPAADTAATAATADDQAPTAAPFWAGVPAREPQAATSIVELLPPPVRSYQ